MLYTFIVVAIILLVGFGYCWGHSACWLKWERWLDGERLSQKAKNRIAGLEK